MLRQFLHTKQYESTLTVRESVLKEASVGVEPTMADLQSAALATWLRRRLRRLRNSTKDSTKTDKTLSEAILTVKWDRQNESLSSIYRRP